MLSSIHRRVIARESNVLRVNFKRAPDPPTPCFPGANGLRFKVAEGNGDEMPTVVAIAGVR